MIEFFKKRILYVPLFLIELYLIVTILLYEFGPIQWQTENVGLFWFFIISYHVVFILGYLVSIKKYSSNSLDRILVKKDNEKSSKSFFDKYSSIIFWMVILICLISCCIEYRNTTFATSYIPYELPANFIKGLFNPAEQYYNKFVASGTFVSNKLVTMISALFSFIYQSMIPIFIFNWDKTKITHKISFFFIVFFKFAIFVSVGTNKGIFDLLFIFGGCLIIDFLLRLFNNDLKSFFKQKSLIAFAAFILVFSFSYFTINITGRVENVIDYTTQDAIKDDGDNQNNVNDENVVVDQNDTNIENQVDQNPNTDNSLVDDNSDTPIVEEEKNESKEAGFFTRMYYAVSNYVTQGYYGMSLALDEEFTTTYGIGNSQFLRSNFYSIFGIDVSDRTYQHKITEQWDENMKWHSFYSYMANDISFYGVILLMFVIGLYFGAVCKDSILNNCLLSKLLLPLFLILFMYMPANNQLLTNMLTCCAFAELTFLWISKNLFLKIKEKK